MKMTFGTTQFDLEDLCRYRLDETDSSWLDLILNTSSKYSRCKIIEGYNHINTLFRMVNDNAASIHTDGLLGSAIGYLIKPFLGSNYTKCVEKIDAFKSSNSFERNPDVYSARLLAREKFKNIFETKNIVVFFDNSPVNNVEIYFDYIGDQKDIENIDLNLKFQNGFYKLVDTKNFLTSIYISTEYVIGLVLSHFKKHRIHEDPNNSYKTDLYFHENYNTIIDEIKEIIFKDYTKAILIAAIRDKHQFDSLKQFHLQMRLIKEMDERNYTQSLKSSRNLSETSYVLKNMYYKISDKYQKKGFISNYNVPIKYIDILNENFSDMTYILLNSVNDNSNPFNRVSGLAILVAIEPTNGEMKKILRKILDDSSSANFTYPSIFNVVKSLENSSNKDLEDSGQMHKKMITINRILPWLLIDCYMVYDGYKHSKFKAFSHKLLTGAKFDYVKSIDKEKDLYPSESIFNNIEYYLKDLFKFISNTNKCTRSIYSASLIMAQSKSKINHIEIEANKYLKNLKNNTISPTVENIEEIENYDEEEVL